MGVYKVTTEDGKSYKVTTEDDKTDWKGVVGSAVGNAFMRPGTVTRKLATDPTAQAKAFPALAGFAGGLSPIPGGATLGTVGGRQLSNAALRAYGQPEQIPSTTSQVGEGALAALGDVIAIPAMKKYTFGKQIGKVEKATGVPPAQDIPSIPMTAGQKSTGEFINDAVQSVKSSGGKGTPSYWLQIKDQVDRLYRMGKDQALTTLDKGRLKWLSGEVQKGLNAAVPGRAGPAAALAKSQTIPRFIGKGFNKIPSRVRAGLGYGTGFGAPVVAVEELIRRLLGR